MNIINSLSNINSNKRSYYANSFGDYTTPLTTIPIRTTGIAYANNKMLGCAYQTFSLWPLLLSDDNFTLMMTFFGGTLSTLYQTIVTYK